MKPTIERGLTFVNTSSNEENIKYFRRASSCLEHDTRKCSTVSGQWQTSHSGGFSFWSRYEWVRWVWPTRSRWMITSSRRGRCTSFGGLMSGWILWSLLLVSAFHERCQQLCRWEVMSGFKSECGIKLFEICKQRPALAVASAAVLPAIPMWLGTHTKVMQTPVLSSPCRRSIISTMNGFWRFLFSILLMQDRESERIRNFKLDVWLIISRAKRIALDSAEKIDALFGNLFTRILSPLTAAEATALPCFEPSVKIFPYPWYKEINSLYEERNSAGEVLDLVPTLYKL